MQSATSGYASLKQIVTGTSAWLRTETSHQLYLGTNQTRAITIDTSQQVGIGTATPQQKQHIHVDSSASSLTQYTNSVTGSGVGDGFLVGLDSTEDGLLWVRE